MPTFGDHLRELREQRDLSLRVLSDMTRYSKSVLSLWENGRRMPPPEAAEVLDDQLQAGGTLAALAAPDVHAAAQRDSERLAALLQTSRGELVDDVESTTARLAVEYLGNPGAALLEEITAARDDVVTSLRARRLRDPHQVHQLLADVGYLSGILSYAALDDGNPRAAMVHTEAAWEAAELVGSNQLRAWVRGTQSLILRFGQRYSAALERAEDGLRYATTGSGRARLLAGVGQCHANMGDRHATRRALANAETAMDADAGRDEMAGLFTFSRAKLYYYSGSSLIWLDGGEDAVRARRQAHTAIELWERSERDRSVADEALARVYAATAALQLHDLESAADELQPILAAENGSSVSWIGKRMERITGMLTTAPFIGAPEARNLAERISALH